AALKVVIALLSTLAVVNTVFILSFIKELNKLHPPERQYTYVGDDYPAQLPIMLPPAALVLSTDASHFSLDADDDWGSLFPLSDGFTTLRPGPSESPHTHTHARGGGRTFLVSMVHQLHCLDVLRVAFATNRTSDPHARVHATHCLRYLRQAVLCHADATLEPDEPGVRDGRWEHAASGVGVVHRCRDWTVLRRYMDAHPAE
ncbi:hypothetical protein C8Q79DRAFT_878344, partial [Trametes meyenii]